MGEGKLLWSDFDKLSSLNTDANANDMAAILAETLSLTAADVAPMRNARLPRMAC